MHAVPTRAHPMPTAELIRPIRQAHAVIGSATAGPHTYMGPNGGVTSRGIDIIFDLSLQAPATLGRSQKAVSLSCGPTACWPKQDANGTH